MVTSTWQHKTFRTAKNQIASEEQFQQNSYLQVFFFFVLQKLKLITHAHNGQAQGHRKILDFNFDGAKDSFISQWNSQIVFVPFLKLQDFFSDLLNKSIFCSFSRKIHILLSKSIFEPFQLLSGHTLPPKVSNKSYQYIIREYAGIVRIVEVGVPGKVMMKSLK